jgi:hypothetical protein
MKSTSFHTSLYITAAITRKMTSSFASLFTTFLVISSLHSTIKITLHGTDAKQEQIVPDRVFPHTHDTTSPLPSITRQPWSTAISSSVDPPLGSTTIVTPVSASLIWNTIFLLFASSQYYHIISNIIFYLFSHICFE